MTKQNIDFNQLKRMMQGNASGGTPMLEEFLLHSIDDAIENCFKFGADQPELDEDGDANPFGADAYKVYTLGRKAFPHLWRHTLGMIARGEGNRPALVLTIEKMINRWGALYAGEEQKMMDAVRNAKFEEFAAIGKGMSEDAGFEGLQKWVGFVGMRVRLYAVHCALCFMALMDMWAAIESDLLDGLNAGDTVINLMIEKGNSEDQDENN